MMQSASSEFRAKFLIGIVVAVLSFPGAAFGQAKEFVCTPCGHPCDDTVVKTGGACRTCQMSLVPRSTVKITNLAAREFCAAIAANPDAIIIDVRSEREFNGTSEAVSTYGHFKKAIHVNVTQLTKRMAELVPLKDKEVFVYCSQNYRSPRAAYYLNMQGFSNVKNLTGGLSKAGDALNSACYREHFVKHKK